MSKLNPTLGADGIERAEFRVPFELSRADIVEILEEYALNVADLDADELSPAEVERAVRDHLWSCGLGEIKLLPPTSAQHAWGERQVLKVWPS